MIWFFLFAAFLSFYVTKKSLPILYKWVPDIPNHRSSHNHIKPRGGGIFFIGIGLLLSLFQNSFLFLLCIPLAIISLIDDLKNIPSIYRFIVQFFTVAIFLLNSSTVNIYINNYPISLKLLIYFLLIIFGTSIINFSNFMDGIDGILAGCMIILLTAQAITNVPSLFPIIGALLGFFILNWPPAKIFMGDIGSSFLGALFACSFFYLENISQIIGILLISTPLLGDALICLIRRFFAGHNIFTAHKMHLYQRLNQGGLTHKTISSIYIAETLVLFLSYVYLPIIFLIILNVFVLLSGYYLDKNFAVPFYNLEH